MDPFTSESQILSLNSTVEYNVQNFQHQLTNISFTENSSFDQVELKIVHNDEENFQSTVSVDSFTEQVNHVVAPM